MTQRLTPRIALLLTLPPLLWAGNAVVGRLMVPHVSPFTLNFLRWLLTALMLLPMAAWALRPGSGLWPHWKRYAMLGLLGVGLYNTLQYLALRTSTPINVTLVASSIPVWMLIVGSACFGQRVSRRQIAGALLSIVGVLVVLSQGRWDHLMEVRLVPGDFYVLLATLAWAFYSWMLAGTREPARVRGDWAAFLLAQTAFGLMWSGAFTAGEWAVANAQLRWSWPMAAGLICIALGPSLIAYRCWGLGIERAGPNVAGFFTNLTPVLAAIMSTLLLGEAPSLYHGVAFALIVGGIVVSARR
jgi:drug/metabolite transporter (DMT)-like permease